MIIFLKKKKRKFKKIKNFTNLFYALNIFCSTQQTIHLLKSFLSTLLFVL